MALQLYAELKKLLIESISLVDTFDYTWILAREYTETLNLSDSVLKSISLDDLTETISLSDDLTTAWIIGRTFTETITLTDGDFYSPSKLLFETLNLTDIDSYNWVLSREYTETLSLSDVILNSVEIIFEETLNLTDTLELKTTKKLTDTLSLTDDLEATKGDEYFQELKEILMLGKEKYESYNTGDDNSVTFYGSDWESQTFTIGNTGTNEPFEVTALRLKLYKEGSPGTIDVSIRNTSAGKPTGGDLSTGQTNGNDLTTDTDGEWIKINLSAYQLQASTQYAIVIRATSGDISNNVKWRADQSSPTYTGGSRVYSDDSGASWNL